MRWTTIFCALALSGAACGGGAGTATQARPTLDDVQFEDEVPREAAPARHAASETVARGEAALAAGNLEQARTLFTSAVEDNPQDPRALLDLGLTLELTNDYPGAESNYRAALAVDPDFPQALNNLGLLLRDLDRRDEAIAMLTHAVEVSPDLAEAHLNLAMAHEEQGNLRDAQQSYEAAVQLGPNEPLARTNLGLLLLNGGETSRAATELRRALRFAGDNVALLQAIGNGLRRADEASGAVMAMERAVAQRETPALLAELALAHRANDDRPAAEQALGRALELDADFADAHYLLGSLVAARGEFTRAVGHFERYLALAPDGPHATRAQAHLAAARARQ